MAFRTESSATVKHVRTPAPGKPQLITSAALLGADEPLPGEWDASWIWRTAQLSYRRGRALPTEAEIV